MRTARLNEMVKGWFIGDFEPSLLRTTSFEVAVKNYSKGDDEPLHYHRVATEFTVVVRGLVEINGIVLRDGDIAVIPPGEAASFQALSDSTTVVVKVPSSSADKFLGSADA